MSLWEGKCLSHSLEGTEGLQYGLPNLGSSGSRTPPLSPEPADSQSRRGGGSAGSGVTRPAYPWVGGSLRKKGFAPGPSPVTPLLYSTKLQCGLYYFSGRIWQNSDCRDEETEALCGVLEIGIFPFCALYFQVPSWRHNKPHAAIA